MSAGAAGSPVRGGLNRAREALVDVTVAGPAGATGVTCIVDTGFTGGLVLPAETVSRLGLRRLGTVVATLADGSQIQVEDYEAELRWSLGTRQVVLTATPSGDALLGTEVLDGYRLTIDYPARSVEIA